METSDRAVTRDKVTADGGSDGNKRKRKRKSDWSESSVTTSSSHKRAKKAKKQEEPTTTSSSNNQDKSDTLTKSKGNLSRKDKTDPSTKDKRDALRKDKNSDTKTKRKSRKLPRLENFSPEENVTLQNASDPSVSHQPNSSITADPLPSQSAVGEDEVTSNNDDSIKQVNPHQQQQPQLHFKGNIRKTKKDKSELCPRCGRGFTSKKRLENHYDETTQTCNTVILEPEEIKNSNYNSEYSDTINAALAKAKMSDEELYGLITEDTTPAESKAVWRRILKQAKVLKCQNEKCSHRASSVPSFKYHFDRCGKVIEKLVCPVCKKCYTTKPGLDYHLGTQHQVLIKSPKSHEEVDLTWSRRSAAIKAANNLAEGSGNPTDDVIPDKQPHSPRAIDGISEVEWIAIKNAFKNNQEIKCPSSFCSLMFKSKNGFRYHVSKCKETKTLTCAICKRQLTTWHRFQNHMLKIHGIGEEACVDSEYTIPKEMTAGSSDDEESKQKTPSRRTTYYNKTILESTYQLMMKKLVEEVKSNEELFIDWQPKLESWTRCDPKEFPLYAPVADLSVKFCFANRKDGHSPVSQLTLFNAAHEDPKYGMTGVIFNVGGPVWSMGWAPYGDDPPSDVQYVAMAAYRTPDETYRVDIPLTYKGLIQLWSVAIGDRPQLPQLSLGIAHEYGCIRNMKWCPSSSCATKPTSCSETMGRLGLLALACSDGVVRILCIPYPDMLLERLGPAVEGVADSNDVFVISKSICCLLSPGNKANQSDFSELYGQCLDVEWFPRQPHNKIAGSFSNGTVTIWNLLTNSWLLKGSHDHCDVVLYPQQHITCHFGSICRAISWCVDDPDYLFTAGYDKRLCLWDLKFPEEPVEKWDRGWCLDSTWPLLSPGVFCLEDLAVKSDSQIRNLAFQEFHTGKPLAVIKSAVPQIGFSYCHWKGALAVGTLHGDLVLKHFVPFVQFFRKPHSTKPIQKRSQILCFCTRECCAEEEEGEQMDAMATTEDRTHTHNNNNNKCLAFYNYPQENEHQLEYKSDVEPVSSVTKVAWNPHHQHCDWLLVATNTGLVRLLKLSS